MSNEDVLKRDAMVFARKLLSLENLVQTVKECESHFKRLTECEGGDACRFTAPGSVTRCPSCRARYFFAQTVEMMLAVKEWDQWQK